MPLSSERTGADHREDQATSVRLRGFLYREIATDTRVRGGEINESRWGNSEKSGAEACVRCETKAR